MGILFEKTFRGSFVRFVKDLIKIDTFILYYIYSTKLLYQNVIGFQFLVQQFVKLCLKYILTNIYV